MPDSEKSVFTRVETFLHG